MAMTIADATIRAQLHTDIKTAWNPVKIWDSPGHGMPSKTDLPRAFVGLTSNRADYGHRSAGLTGAVLLHCYTLALEAPWPAAGSSIEATKVSQAQALVTLLTASSRYATYVRRVKDLRYDTSLKGQEQEPILRIEIDFELEVVTCA